MLILLLKWPFSGNNKENRMYGEIGRKKHKQFQKHLQIAVKNLPKQHFDQRIKVTETKKFSLLGFIQVAISFGQIIKYRRHKF